MADRSLTDLNYGYPGAAIYDLGSNEWAFARQFSSRSFEQIRAPDSSHLAETLATVPAQFADPQTSANSAILEKEVRSHIQDNPQLAPAAALLPELNIISSAISATTSAYDPLVGGLLSFGSITLKDRHENPRKVAALPTGEAGNILQLAVLNTEKLGWGMVRKTWVEGWTLREAECGHWNEEAASIQQICFSQSEDRSSLLAVRLPTRTVLFHPISYRRAHTTGSSPFYDLPASTIDAHPVFSIDKEITGGFPHSHVAFNPRFQRQFALVDQSPMWSIWNIDFSREDETYTPSCLVRGRISNSETEEMAGEDGWARILWVADVNTLLVCNRRYLSIVSISGGKSNYLPCPKLLSERSTEWFLDVKQHPNHVDQVFVLTSTRLVLILVNSPDKGSASFDGTGATTLASWRHYRDAEDFTLQIDLQMLSGDGKLGINLLMIGMLTKIELCLMLYSQVNNLIQLYTFSEHPTGISSMVACSDPGILDLTIDGPGRITNLHMEPMQQGGIRMNINFFRLFATLSGSGVHELVIYTGKSLIQEPLAHRQIIEDFTRSTIKRPRMGIPKSESIGRHGESMNLGRLNPLKLPKSTAPLKDLEQEGSLEDAPVHRTENYRILYEALQYPVKPESDASGFMDIEAVTDEVKEMLDEDPGSAPLPIGTLMEYANAKLYVLDVDTASSNLQDLLSESEENDLYIERVASVRTLDLTVEGNPTISDVYDALLQTWVAPLPSDVSSRVRQSKERLARRIAAEVLLSSMRLREHDLDEAITGSQSGIIQDRSIALPILPSRPKSGDFDFAFQYGISQLPTPPHSSVPPSSQPPSSLPGSSPPVLPITQSALPDPLARLGKYLRTTKPSRDPVDIRANASQVLKHWEVGAHPSEYNWAATERALQPEVMDEESQKQREKERKRKERREKRQQREDELARAKAASQAAIFSRSSPGPMLGDMGSSSQIPSQSQSRSQVPILNGGFVPQSQVEPGKFGGRLEKKKKKKGRISGF
ncbi:hypothetical protein yc1106_03244 [Curvularia clavata]|uniref:RNA polymerase I-specific transcription initiation factor RRN6-like protein n=1 Tax=Curvularia clavata TaxID=95742 RepID=A0A9Q9DRF2_CURCL|nr:hypothetical protein yc1106_03244 [Curvularia clavata]